MRPSPITEVITVTEKALEQATEEKLLDLVTAAGLSTDGIETLPALRRMIALSGRKTPDMVV